VAKKVIKYIWLGLVYIVVGLVENAFFGWVGENIAATLRLSSPTVADAVQGAWTWGIPAVTTFALFWAYHRWFSHYGEPKPSKNELSAIYDEKDLSLGDAIFHVAARSAWARWQNASKLAKDGRPVDELSQMNVASSIFETAARNGAIRIRGRLRGTIQFEDISPDLWHIAALAPRKDLLTPWKVEIMPCSGVDLERIPKYESMIVDAAQVRCLWPRKDWRTDLSARKLLLEARLKSFWKSKLSSN
jgi:hypothetical protein